MSPNKSRKSKSKAAADQADPATSVHNTTSRSLPPELWLNTFSNLDYMTLKVVAMVSTSFKALSEHRSLGKISLRHVAPLAAGVKFESSAVVVHPLLQEMSYECRDDVKYAYLHSYKATDSPYSDHGMYRLINTSAIDEFATMPALKAIQIRIRSTSPFEIKNESGVTVRQVLEGLVDYFGRPRNYQSCMLFDVAPWLADKQKYPDIENRKANYSELYMGDHTSWTGFDRQTLDKNGVLILTAGHFDSYHPRRHRKDDEHVGRIDDLLVKHQSATIGGCTPM